MLHLGKKQSWLFAFWIFFYTIFKLSLLEINSETHTHTHKKYKTKLNKTKPNQNKKEQSKRFNPLTPKISSIILLLYNFYDVSSENLELRLINNPLIYIFLYSHHLSAWFCIVYCKEKYHFDHLWDKVDLYLDLPHFHWP